MQAVYSDDVCVLVVLPVGCCCPNQTAHGTAFWAGTSGCWQQGLCVYLVIIVCDSCCPKCSFGVEMLLPSGDSTGRRLRLKCRLPGSVLLLPPNHSACRMCNGQWGAAAFVQKMHRMCKCELAGLKATLGHYISLFLLAENRGNRGKKEKESCAFLSCREPRK